MAKLKYFIDCLKCLHNLFYLMKSMCINILIVLIVFQYVLQLSGEDRWQNPHFLGLCAFLQINYSFVYSLAYILLVSVCSQWLFCNKVLFYYRKLSRLPFSVLVIGSWGPGMQKWQLLTLWKDWKRLHCSNAETVVATGLHLSVDVLTAIYYSLSLRRAS